MSRPALMPDRARDPDDVERHLESLAADGLRAGETDDPTEAAEEGLTWVPPVDPPIVAGDDGQPQVAAGFATTAHDEPFDEDHHDDLLSPHDEVEDRVLEALEAHAETAGLVHDLTVDVEGGQAVLSGTVEDLEDEEAVLAVAEEVPGITRAVSRLEIRSLADRSAG